MSTAGQSLARALLGGGESFSFRAQSIPFEITDTLVTVRMGRTVALGLPGGASFEIDVKRAPLQQVLDVCPEAVWVCGFRVKDGTGTLMPFAPPRRVVLSTSLPLRIPSWLEEKAKEFRLRAGRDALARFGLDVGGRRVAIVGQRSIAAISDDDARDVTWWLPDGDVVETRLILREGKAWFELRHLIAAREATSARCGPNSLVLLEPGSRLPLHGEGEEGVPEAAALGFLMSRSPLFDAWAQYVALSQELEKNRQEARAVSPLRYEKARQIGRTWVAQAKSDEAGLLAWLGAGVVEGRKVRIDQTVLLEGVEGEGRLTVEKVMRKAPGLLEFHFKPGRGVRDIPASGVLRAVENQGNLKQKERQSQALDVLRAGRAACPRLLDILNNPSHTQPPAEVRLPRPILERLDEHQEAALRKIIGCQEVVAIQGPPGTGKTRVIVEALRQLAASRRKGQRPVRVLISSVQNEAIDNVVERLEALQGIVVRTVRRKGHDEDEDFSQAERSAWGRGRIIEALEARLEKDPIVRKLRVLKDVRAEVERFQLLLLAGEPVFGKVADALTRFAGDESAPFTASSRDEARSLAEALRSRPLSFAPTAGDAAPRLPERAEDVQEWWAVARETWPVASRAQVEEVVTGVVEAVEGMKLNHMRWERRVEGRWQLLRVLLEAALPGTARGEPRAEEDPDEGLMKRLDSWAKRAAEDVRHCAEGLDRTPQSVAARFLSDLRDDPSAWETITRRHGNTTAATCSMSAKARSPEEPSYDWVIIDEAGRASPFELLVPMVQGQRIVLIGDHRQLPPMVEEEIAAALERDRKPAADLQQETLFGDFYTLLPDSCRIRLQTQYRMHGKIGALVDRLFYRPRHEALDSYYSGPELEPKRRPFWGVLEDRPVVWLDLPRNRKAVYQNKSEVRAVIQLLAAYAEAAGGQESFVGVICAYADQKEALVRALKSRPELSAIANVRTIDSVQGREYPVVLFCTSRMDGRPGFLASPQRVNVALSRAQRQLVVLGSTSALSEQAVRAGAPHLFQLMRYCQEDKLVVPWKEELAE